MEKMYFPNYSKMAKLQNFWYSSRSRLGLIALCMGCLSSTFASDIVWQSGNFFVQNPEEFTFSGAL